MKKIKDGIVRVGKDLVGIISISVKKMQPDFPHGMKVANLVPFSGFPDSSGVRGPPIPTRIHR